VQAEEVLSLYFKVAKDFFAEFDEEERDTILKQIIEVYSLDDD
jgi:hypothetical protein